MAKATPRAELVEAVRDAEAIVMEALPVNNGLRDDLIIARRELRAAAMPVIVRELLDVEVTDQRNGQLVDIDMHRWYAVIRHPDGPAKVIGVQGRDGLGLYDSVEEWEQINS